MEAGSTLLRTPNNPWRGWPCSSLHMTASAFPPSLSPLPTRPACIQTMGWALILQLV